MEDSKIIGSIVLLGRIYKVRVFRLEDRLYKKWRFSYKLLFFPIHRENYSKLCKEINEEFKESEKD